MQTAAEARFQALPLSEEVKSLRVPLRVIFAFAITIAVGGIALACYALVIRAQAEALLKDLTSLKVGSSTQAEVEHLTQRHRGFLVSQDCNEVLCSTIFKVQNSWLSALRLEPEAWLSATIAVKRGRVAGIGASLFRRMKIFPTFEASAGIVEEYAEYPKYLANYPHYYFPTPVGKPYLKVMLDSQASPVQRQRAFNFSFRCLIKPGGACDLPCDYLPSAWQDWRDSLARSGLESENFLRHYPNSSRCKP